MGGVSNTQGSFNTGRDCTVVLVHSTLGRFDLPNVTGFNSAQRTVNINVDRMDGVQLNAEVPKGWAGSFDLERGTPVVDSLFAQMESLWIDQGNYGSSTIYQYVAETDGSRSTFQYDNVAIKLDDAGAYRSDSSVRQRISWSANRRRKI